MHFRCLIIVALAFLLSACQVWQPASSAQTSPQLRFQGEISRVNGTLQFKVCRTQDIYRLEDVASLGLRRNVDNLMTGNRALFADLRGLVGNIGHQKKLSVNRIFRLQNEGPGCYDQNFKRTIIVAVGHEPEWLARVSSRGLLIERLGEESPFVAPYVVESVPNGGSSYSTEANGQKIELWIAPSNCVDNMSGTVMGYSTELRINHETLRGCAYPGALGER